jgi:hypothetical protein
MKFYDTHLKQEFVICEKYVGVILINAILFLFSHVTREVYNTIITYYHHQYYHFYSTVNNNNNNNNNILVLPLLEMVMEWKANRRKQSCLIQRKYSSIFLGGMRKTTSNLKHVRWVPEC